MPGSGPITLVDTVVAVVDGGGGGGGGAIPLGPGGRGRTCSRIPRGSITTRIPGLSTNGLGG